MRPIIPILCAAIVLSGCAVTIPLQATSDDGETMSGTATNFAGDPYGGTFELRGVSGVVCSGTYRYQPDLSGSAPLACSNGQAGFVRFKSDGFHGAGDGTIGDRRFRVTF